MLLPNDADQNGATIGDLLAHASPKRQAQWAKVLAALDDDQAAKDAILDRSPLDLSRVIVAPLEADRSMLTQRRKVNR